MRTRAWAAPFVVLFGCGDDIPSQADSTGSSTEASTGDGTTGASVVTSGPISTTGLDDSTTTEAGSSSTGEPQPQPEPLMWVDECIGVGSDFSTLHPRLQCAGAVVPLDWDDPEGETIEIAAFRIRTESPDRKGAVWHLDGGPGGSGISFLSNPESVDELNDAGWDVIVHSHRGTLIPQLSCLDSPNSASCRTQLQARWGDGLRHFNTVQAAHDQAHMMSRAGVDDDGLAIVYGVSYGSYWGQYLLGLHPDVADGVILDSVLGAYDSVENQEPDIDGRMIALLDACVSDPLCGPRVGYASGQAFAQAVIDAFDQGDCGAQDLGTWSESAFQGIFGSLLNTSVARNYLPLLAALLARCTPQDSQLVEDAIDPIFTGAFSAAPDDGVLLDPSVPSADRYGVAPDAFYAPVMFPVVLATTMLPDDASVILTDAPLATTGLAGAVAGAHAEWADLPNVEFDAEFVPTIPVLILNATYDLQTPLPWAQSVAEQYGLPVVEIPDGRHSVFSPSPGSRTGDGGPCVRSLVLSFAAAPEAPLEDACLADLPQIDVNLTRPDLAQINVSAFALDDPWTLLD